MSKNEAGYTRFAEIILGMAGNFQGMVEKNTMKLWFRIFNNNKYTIQQLSQAAIKIIENRQYKSMPPWAEIQEAIEFCSGKIPVKNKALLEVNNILKQIEEVGYYGIPSFNDPITANLLKTRWKWRDICDLETNKIQWFVKEFVEFYLAHAEAGVLALAAPNNEVAGLIESIGEEVK